MKPLDFVIIGAQKCATTTLFELLRQHPLIRMPLEKEVPFFTREVCDIDAWTRFAEDYFAADRGSERPGTLWGKATPQYMASPDVPARMAATMPGCKLIAVLRDPLERSASHYRMGLRRGTEERTFDAAMRANLQPDSLQRARTLPPPEHRLGYESEQDFYLSWSEYGRQLTGFLEHFPREQLLILYTRDLESDPRGVLDNVLHFLDLDPGFEPRGLGEVKHAGGGAQRIPNHWRAWLRERSLISWVWKKVPKQQQGRLRFLYERWNTSQRASDLSLAPATRAALAQYFRQDLRLLGKLAPDLPPWAERYAPTMVGEATAQ